MRAMEIKMRQNKRSNEQNNSLALVFRTLFMLKLIPWPNNKESKLTWSVYRNTDGKLFHFQDGTQRYSHTLY